MKGKKETKDCRHTLKLTGCYFQTVQKLHSTFSCRNDPKLKWEYIKNLQWYRFLDVFTDTTVSRQNYLFGFLPSIGVTDTRVFQLHIEKILALTKNYDIKDEVPRLFKICLREMGQGERGFKASILQLIWIAFYFGKENGEIYLEIKTLSGDKIILWYVLIIEPLSLTCPEEKQQTCAFKKVNLQDTFLKN